MKDYSFLAVMNIKIVCTYMLAHHKSITEALHSYVTKDLVIILIAGSVESDSMTELKHF